MKEKLAKIALLNEELLKLYDWMWSVKDDGPFPYYEFEQKLIELESITTEIYDLTEEYLPKKDIKPVSYKEAVKDFFDFVDAICNDFSVKVNHGD